MPLSSAQTQELVGQYLTGNYMRNPVSMVRGEGSYLWDAEGRRYLDLLPGLGVDGLGHCHPRVVAALREQTGKLLHIHNNYLIEGQALLGKALIERLTGMPGAKAFFCNSGTEANEAAIKLARLHTPKQRYKIITFEGGFHGRTLGATTATAQPKYHEGLGPLMAGFLYAPFGDLDAVRRLIDNETAAIMIEPIQGEGGVRIAPPGFLQGLRELCDQHELLLIFDEVQTGCGRTGKWFAYQQFDVTPDIMTLAKALCGGVAGGALLTTREIAPSLRPGMHAATFGGNPLAARAGIATLEMIESERLLDQAQRLGEVFRQRMTALASECELISDVRVMGVMIGVELKIPGADVVKSCLDRKLLINCTQGNVLRLLPAMNLTEAQTHEGCDIIAEAVKQQVR